MQVLIENNLMLQNGKKTGCLQQEKKKKVDMFGMKVITQLLLLSSFGLAVLHLLMVVLLYAMMDGVMIIIVVTLGIMYANGN